MGILKEAISPILVNILDVLSEHFCCVPQPDEMDTSFVELGANSLMLMELSRGIEKRFGLRILLRQFFEEIATVQNLFDFVKANLSRDWTPEARIQSEKEIHREGVKNISDLSLAANEFIIRKAAADESKAHLPYLDCIMNCQIQATTQGVSQIVEKQLAFLQQIKGIDQINMDYNASPTSKKMVAIDTEADNQYQKSVEHSKSEILWGLPELDIRKLDSDQQRFVQKLQHTFSEKTKKSKANALESRMYFANNRPSLGFRLETKEMFYPIVSSHSDGPYLYDIDGNEYIDLALGFGVHMFGHKPKFIYDALKEQIEKGIQIGPQSELTTMVAKQFCEITGNERVTFYNSGTEAVMTAIRVARAATGKNKIVMFSGAYHGHSDTTLMVSGENKGKQTIQPMCIGIPNVYAHEVVVLPYDNEFALETIDSLKDELAAVLVEPVQSRQPNLQPVSFLKKLRKFTNYFKIVLIFDEMITGFRIKPGGAQAYFGIKPDLSTYGKVIGGGMPIGCVAGRADLMSYIDGGFWDYGDRSYPRVQKVYTGGTFCNHPLTMRSALAVLNRLKSEGENLQDGLSKTTEDFGREINIFFESENIPIRMVNFGSLFRFVMSKNFSYVYQPLEMDLFHSMLISKGVFTWEGRTCYFSIAHTKEILEKLMEIIKSSVLEMKAGGFFLKNVKKAEIIAPKDMLAGLQVPMTESQKQLWILYRANKAAFDAYTYAIGFKIKGHVEADVLKKSIETLAANHEALRTFIDMNGEFQTILPNVDVSFTEVDFTPFGYNQQNSAIQKWFLDQYTEGFKLEKAPLFRFYLLKLKKKENLLVIFSHHIAVDGLSEQVMLREIIKFYNAIQSGQSLIQEKTMQLSQYVQSMLAHAHQDLIKAKKSYWENKMIELSLSLNLPADRIHPHKPSFRGIRKKVVIDQELNDFIKDFSKKNGCSNFMTWLSYYMLWLHKISAQDQLVVFTLSSGRYFDNSSNMIGYCANPIIVKSDLSHNPIFEDFFKEVKKELLNVYEHQEYPFSELIREFGKTLKLENRLPFTALFNMDHIYLDKMGDVELELYFAPIQSVIADINLNVTETDDAFILCFDFNTDIFEENSIHRLIETFIPMIKNSLSSSGARVSEVLLLEEANLDLVTKVWNETSLHYGRYNYIHELFEVQARMNPQRTAVVVGSQSLTYDELNRKSNQLSHFLKKQNLAPNQPIGLLFNNSVELIIGILGVLKAGNAYVPIDPRYPNERVTDIIDGSSISLAVTVEELLNKLPSGIKAIALNRDTAQIQQESVENLHIEIKPDYLCYVINTSGSTGLPKSVGLTHRNITNMINWFLSTNQIRAEDKVFLFTSICFDLTQKNIYTALSAGAQLHISLFTVYDPYVIRDYIEKEKITWITCTPSVIAPMIESDSEDQLRKLESIRYVYLGGEVARKSIFKNWIESKSFNAIIVNTYGPTECSDVVTVYPISKVDLYRESEFSIGKPIPNLKVYILDKYQKPLPIGIMGEICIAGNGVSIGYLNDSEKSKAKFIPNPFCSTEAPIMYKTGDLGRFRSDGNIDIIGRNDNQVKIRGFRIELEEIETVILKHALISNVAVSAKKVTESEVKLIAYISFKKNVEKKETINHKSLRDFIKNNLPDYMVPDQFIVLDSFILNSNGKIDRKKLEEQAGKILENNENTNPETAIEERIVEMCKSLLGIQRIGTNANFFESGGHSLKAVQLASLLFNEFNVQLSLKDLFNAGTIKNIASLISIKSFISPFKKLSVIEKRPYYPVTSIQKNMFFLQQMGKENCHYNMPFTVMVQGKIDKDQTEYIFNALVKRHEILRTSFDLHNNEIVQVVHDNVKIIVDYSEIDNDNIHKIMHDFVKPFNLGEAPLIRVKLIKISEVSSALLIDIHHIISDAISLNILLKEFFKVYSGEELPTPLFQYKDYAVMQNEMITSGSIKYQEQYWRKILDDDIQECNLPVDYLRPSVKSFDGATITFSVDCSVTERIREITRKADATMFMFLFSLHAILLSKYSNNEDIITGIPVSERDLPELDGVIGPIFNTLAMRSFPKGDKTFIEFLNEVKNIIFEVFNNRNCPLLDLLDRVNVHRDLSRNSLYENMFVYQKDDTNFMDTIDLKLEYVDITPAISKFDFTLFATEKTDEIIFKIEYCTKLFKRETIERIVSHFRTLLDNCIKTPDNKIHQLGVLNKKEKQILKKYNSTTDIYPKGKLLHQLFEEQVIKSPDIIALDMGEQKITYKQLNERSNQLSHYLRNNGIKPGMVIGVLMERSPNFIISVIGIIKAGACFLPLDPVSPVDRIKYILNDCGVSLLITNRYLHSKIDFEGNNLFIEEENFCNRMDCNLTSINNPTDLAYIIYTSGSTGKPKGVLIDHNALLNYIWWASKKYVKGRMLNFAFFTSVSFDLTITSIFTPLITGNRLIIYPDSQDVALIQKVIKENRANIIKCTPSHLKLLHEIKVENHGAKVFIIGGEQLETNLCKKIERNLPNGIEIYNEYGPTEATVGCMIHKFNNKKDVGNAVPIGIPAANMKIYILDKYLNQVPINVTGEIYIAGLGLAHGYINDEFTSQKFIKNPHMPNEILYKTGDLAKMLDSNIVEYIGRVDNQIKIHGHRIELDEISSVLCEHEFIKDSVVILTDLDDISYLCAYYISKNNRDIINLAEYLSRKIPQYMVPKLFIRVTEIPLSTNGKVNLKKLPKPNLLLNDMYCAPENSVEERMYKVWQKSLNLNRIGTKSNFFAVGGHSLNAVKLITNIKKEFNVDLPLTELYQNPTIHLLSKILPKHCIVNPNIDIPNIVLLKKGNSEKNIFIIHPGTGEINIYWALCNMLENDINYWGIRANRLDGLSPQNLSIEDVATRYISQIQKIQPVGPYFIAGWCIGGTIAFEIVRQMEYKQDIVSALVLISSPAPGEDFSDSIKDFSVETEINFISSIGPFKNLIDNFEYESSIEETWHTLIKYSIGNKIAPEVIKDHIPSNINVSLPFIDGQSMNELVYYLNVLRTYFRARALYIPKGIINTRTYFIEPEKEASAVTIEGWEQFIKKGVSVKRIGGDHYSMFLSVKIDELANAINSVISST